MKITRFMKRKTIRAYVLIERDGTLEKGVGKLPHLWTSRKNAKSWVDAKGYPWTAVVPVRVTVEVI